METLLLPTVNWTPAGVTAAFESERVREPWRPAAVAVVSVPKESVPRSAVARSKVLPASEAVLPRIKTPSARRVVPV